MIPDVFLLLLGAIKQKTQGINVGDEFSLSPKHVDPLDSQWKLIFSKVIIDAKMLYVSRFPSV